MIENMLNAVECKYERLEPENKPYSAWQNAVFEAQIPYLWGLVDDIRTYLAESRSDFKIYVPEKEEISYSDTTLK